MKIVVLAGGISTERDVSLVSGKNVYEALCFKGHQVVLLDVYLGYEGNIENIFEQDVDWVAQVGNISEECPDLEAVKALRKDGDKNFFGPNVLTICQEADVVFMALHGECGEDGKIQAAFDLFGIRYTGTDAVSSAMCMDKAITKDIFKAYGYYRQCAESNSHNLLFLEFFFIDKKGNCARAQNAARRANGGNKGGGQV